MNDLQQRAIELITQLTNEQLELILKKLQEQSQPFE